MKCFWLMAAAALGLCGAAPQVLAWAAVDDDEIIPCILYLEGVSDAEELSAEVLEQYLALRRRPLPLNRSSRERLAPLLGPWRAAAVADYRDRGGAVLSWTELASVDGFTPELVEALRPFLSLETASTTHRLRAESQIRSSLRRDDGSAALGSYAAKLRLSDADRWEVAATCRRSYAAVDASMKPEDVSGAVTVYGGRRHFRQFTAGDYYARFGSGLGLWSGFSMSGLSGVQAFSRRGSGISPAWTVSPSSAMRGAAACWQFGDWSFTPMVSLGQSGRGPACALAVARLGRQREQTLVLLSARDEGSDGPLGRLSLGDHRSVGHLRIAGRDLGAVDIAGEGAVDVGTGAVAATLSMTLTPSYGHKIAMLARWYPQAYRDAYAAGVRASAHTSDEVGAALGVQLPHVQSVLDISRRMSTGAETCKSVTSADYELLGDVHLKPRLVIRHRPADIRAWRTDMRLDAVWEPGRWRLTARANAVRCRDLSQLYYGEAGYKGERLSAYLRAMAFAVDRWDDRIYCYERDVPGCFNVPTYYGRGVALACTGSWTVGLHARRGRMSGGQQTIDGLGAASSRPLRHRLSWRLSWTHYTAGPLATSKGQDVRILKPDRVEMRIQYSIDL